MPLCRAEQRTARIPNGHRRIIRLRTGTHYTHERSGNGFTDRREFAIPTKKRHLCTTRATAYTRETNRKHDLNRRKMKSVIGMGNALTDILINLKTDEVLERFMLPRGSMNLVDSDRQRRIGEYVAGMPRTLSLGGSASNTIRAMAAWASVPAMSAKWDGTRRETSSSRPSSTSASNPISCAETSGRAAASRSSRPTASGRCALFSAPRSRCGATN